MKWLTLLFILLPCFLLAMNILISDSVQWHAETCSTYIKTYCPTANITIRYETLSSSVTYAIANDIDIISRSAGGLSDNSQITGAIAYVTGGSIGIVHAHGENTHIEYGNPSYLGYIVAVGAGTNGINTESYGAGLEWFVNGEIYESWATAISAGMIGQLMIGHSWTFNQARQALRQTASNWETGWIPDGGFGYVDYNAADSLETAGLFSLNCIYNVRVIENWEGYIEIDWTDVFSSSWDVSVDGYSTAFDETVSSSIYSKNHSVNDLITFNIFPTNGRVEPYCKTTITSMLGTTIYLRPNGDDTISGGSHTGSNYYSEVNEATLDLENYFSGNYSGDDCSGRMTIQNPTASGVINSVTMKGHSLSTAVGDCVASICRFGVTLSSTDYDGAETIISNTGNWPELTASCEYSVNPETLSAWTWEEIDSLKVWVSIVNGGGDSGSTSMYQLWIEVSYIPESNGWINKICGVNNAATINGVSTANIKSVMGVE